LSVSAREDFRIRPSSRQQAIKFPSPRFRSVTRAPENSNTSASAMPEKNQNAPDCTTKKLKNPQKHAF
jgi:hypothetical protein